MISGYVTGISLVAVMTSYMVKGLAVILSRLLCQKIFNDHEIGLEVVVAIFKALICEAPHHFSFIGRLYGIIQIVKQ